LGGLAPAAIWGHGPARQGGRPPGPGSVKAGRRRKVGFAREWQVIPSADVIGTHTTPGFRYGRS